MDTQIPWSALVLTVLTLAAPTASARGTAERVDKIVLGESRIQRQLGQKVKEVSRQMARLAPVIGAGTATIGVRDSAQLVVTPNSIEIRDASRSRPLASGRWGLTMQDDRELGATIRQRFPGVTAGTVELRFGRYLEKFER